MRATDSQTSNAGALDPASTSRGGAGPLTAGTPEELSVLFAKAFQASPHAMIITDEATRRVVEVSDRFCEFFGEKRETLVGRVNDLALWVDGQSCEEVYAELLREGMVRGREVQVYDRDRQVRTGRFSGVVIELGGRRYIHAVFEDLTELKRAEAALRESEERFSKAFHSSVNAVAIADFPEGRIWEVNDAYCQLFGFQRQEIIGRNAAELGLWADLRERQRFWEIINREGTVREMAMEQMNHAGERLTVLVSAHRLEIRGRPMVVVSLADITEQRKALQALRESEEKFSKAFHATPDSMSINVLDDGRFLEVNDAFTRIHGWIREETIGRTSAELGLWAQPADRERIVARLRRSERVVDAPVVMRDKAGRSHQCLFSAEKIDVGGRPCLFCLVRDVTEQRRLEDRLHQAQKMESIGQLAGGVAHDFNNILTVIQGHASFLLEDASLSPAARESAREIRQSADFAANLTRQLLLFSRRQALQRGRLAVDAIIGRTRELLHRVISENVRLELRLAPELPDILADAGMVEQVLLNLSVNAQDAMPRGGRITISTLELRADVDYVRRVPPAREGRFVGIAVADTGEGIAPEILPRIFDPFFTTKEEGKGTGLGLATVYGIMEQHGGWVEVDSKPGAGARFTVWFPVADKQDSAPPLPPSSPPADLHGHEAILVVEDKAEVRAVVEAVLKRFGYQVVLAGDGDEALARWRDHREQIALLFTDVIMPGRLTGRDLAGRLRADRPELKVIFCSGYDADVLDAAALQARGTRFITKPFDVARLVEVVRELLNSD